MQAEANELLRLVRVLITSTLSELDTVLEHRDPQSVCVSAWAVCMRVWAIACAIYVMWVRGGTV